MWLLCVSSSPASANLLWHDAVVARVNGVAILQSDLEIYSRLYGNRLAFADQPPAQQERLISALIQHHLLLAEADRFGVAAPSPVAVQREVTSLRQQQPPLPTWIDEAALADAARDHLWVAALVNARIRSFVMIRDAQVAIHLARQGGPRPDETAALARTRIRRILTDQEADTRLATYLQQLQKRADIKRYTSATRE